MTDEMSAKDRDALIRFARAQARQAEREVDTRVAICHAEVADQMTAAFAADDAIWKEAVLMAGEEAEKANARIRTEVASLGIPASEAPQISMQWYSRGSSYGNRDRRNELYKLADAKLAAMAKAAKGEIRAAALEVEKKLILGGLQSDEARAVLESMPSAEALMPSLSLDDLGVKRWQPPEDVATQLTTPLSATQRRRRLIRRAIIANPDLGDREIAEMITNCDDNTVAVVRREESGVHTDTDFRSLRARLEQHD
jgi:hypothetical protein